MGFIPNRYIDRGSLPVMAEEWKWKLCWIGKCTEKGEDCKEDAVVLDWEPPVVLLLLLGEVFPLLLWLSPWSLLDSSIIDDESLIVFAVEDEGWREGSRCYEWRFWYQLAEYNQKDESYTGRDELQYLKIRKNRKPVCCSQTSKRSGFHRERFAGIWWN